MCLFEGKFTVEYLFTYYEGYIEEILLIDVLAHSGGVLPRLLLSLKF